MSTTKILAAAICAATVGLACAQGVPPRPATDPAVGAGQRSTQNTPMGPTGTPGGSGAMAQGSTGPSTAATSAASTGTTMNSGSTSSSMNSGAMVSNSGTMAGGTHHKKAKKHKHHVAKADRN